MKAILEFDLDDPEDKVKHKDAINGEVFKFFCQEFSQQELRRLRKYAELGEEAQRVVEELEKNFYDGLDDFGLDLWND